MMLSYVLVEEQGLDIAQEDPLERDDDSGPCSMLESSPKALRSPLGRFCK